MKPQHPQGRASARSLLLPPAQSILDNLEKISYVSICLSFGLMALIVSVQVFMRYVLDSSIDSAMELSRLLFVCTIFLAIPPGIAHGTHVGIDAVVSRLPEALKKWCWRITTALCLVLMVTLSWLAIGAISDKWQALMPTLDVTASVFYFPVFFCGIHSSLHLIVMLLKDQVPEAKEGV